MIGLLQTAPLLLSWVACFWLCRELAARRKIDPDWRLSWVLASAGWGTLVTAVTELTSLTRSLTARTVFVTWLLLCLTLTSAAAWCAAKRGLNLKLSFGRLGQKLDAIKQSPWPLDLVVMWFFTAGVILLLGWIALAVPTTTGDSLTYHLVRIMHWMQQQSVAHFPTGNCRQNELGPWSEFAMTHLHLLFGNDRLVNLVQWFSMLSCVLLTPLIARHLWLLQPSVAEPAAPAAQLLRRRMEALTALLVVTLPIGIVEAVTTQTDYVTAYWLGSLLCLGLALLRDPANPWYALGAGLALGLGVLTKATMFIYAAPVLATLCWHLWFRARCRMFVPVLLLTFAAINAGHMWRNYSLVKHPLAGPEIHRLVSNKTVSIGGTMSNVIRNLALETTTPFKPLNQIVNSALSFLHRFTGQDLNDPDTTYELCLFQWHEALQIYDSQASNPLHLLLIGVAGVVGLARFREHRPLLAYAGLITASFILFCALLRWQEWHSRMHLPYLVWLMPFVAVICVTRLPAFVPAAATMMAMAAGIHCLFKNESRPLLDPNFFRIPREAQSLYIHGPHFYESYRRACQEVVASGCPRIGLKLEYGTMEYAFWVMLRNRGFQGRLDHVYVEDASAKILRPGPPPCVVLTNFDPPPTSVTNDFPVVNKYEHVAVCWPDRARPARSSSK